MKKCPECGNPSYDGAPVCGNCGYKFPKAKVAPSKREDIFQQAPKVTKSSESQSTLDIIKEKKLLIGIIILITLIVICGIVLTGSNNKTSDVQSSDLGKYNAGNFSFDYPNTWKTSKLVDPDHENAKFFKTNNGTVVEYYNITSDYSLKQINQERISLAQENGDYVNLLETITLDGSDASNVILESPDGNFTRYVSMLDNGKLYAFKITGNTLDSVTSDEINNVINSADIA